MKKIILFASLGILTAITIVFCCIYYPLTKYPHKLAICAMFKNEATWLKEWIEYHRLLGATHFYLYNNDSTDNYQEILQPYINSGLVEIIDWTSANKAHAIYGYDENTFVPYQIGAFTDCMKNRARGKALWVAVIDVDEFLVHIQPTSFHSFLMKEAFCKKGALKLHWRIFGTSNVSDLLPGELLTEKLTLRALDKHPWNNNVKTLYRPEAVDLCFVHEPKHLNPGYKKKRLDPSRFRIHHYWTRTASFLTQKRNPSPQDLAKFNTDFNAIEDKSILPLLPALRSAMSAPNQICKEEKLNHPLR